MTIENLLEPNGLFDNRYRLIKRLSDEGATADVWLAIDTFTLDKRLNDENNATTVANEDSGSRVAIKIYRPKNALDVEGESLFVKEFKTAYNCQHENLLTPTGYGIANDIPYLVMPYCSKGSAENLVGKMTDEIEIWKFLQQTASGLAYLHSCKPPIIHQDIKPGNILIDDNGNYRITDFGISVKREYKSDSFLDDKDSGTADYMPPERFGNNVVPWPESDIWSLGATLFELITGSTPFSAEGGKAQFDNSERPQIDIPISKELKQIVYMCLDANMAQRPTASVINKTARARAIKPNNRNRFLILTLISLIVAIIGVFTWWRLRKDTNIINSDYIQLFAGTWIYDNPEIQTSEKINYDTSGIFHAVYHQYLTNVDEDVTGVYRIENILGAPHLIGRYRIKDGRSLTSDWTITVFNQLQVSYIINKTPDNNAGGQRFTYSKLLDEVFLEKGKKYTLDLNRILPDSIFEYSAHGDSRRLKPVLLSYHSHDSIIAQVDSSGIITGQKPGRTYIDVVTTEGTGVIEVNVQ